MDTEKNNILTDKEDSINRGLSRRQVIIKAAWMAPMILSTQLSGEVLAQIASCSHPGDNCTCTPAGDDTCSRCEIKQSDNLCPLMDSGCPNSCDWCDGGIFDICNPNF